MTGNVIIDALIIMSILGLLSAIILHFVAKAFYVYEDPKIDEVASFLPGANCGGCGYAGCRNLAETIVKSGNLDGKYCPAGGNTVMTKIASLMGTEVGKVEPKVAVVRCQRTAENSVVKVFYDAALSCAFANTVFAGENLCPYSCLGCGDCVKACSFDAIHIDETTKLPVVDDSKCGGCGGCARACPRQIIEVRHKGIKSRRVYVSCMNRGKGVYAKKNCDVACIGCGKCVKICPFEAISLNDNLAYIDYNKCKLCRKCEKECPTGAIKAVNFPTIKQITSATEA